VLLSTLIAWNYLLDWAGYYLPRVARFLETDLAQVRVARLEGDGELSVTRCGS